MSTEEFIQKAHLVHGDKYDYSKVEYINNHTKVCIICKEHGEFWQTPSNHLQKQGCPLCSKIIKGLSQETAYHKLQNILQSTGYIIKPIFVYNGDRNTTVTLYCPQHNYEWTVEWHNLIYNYRRKGQYCGCKMCQINYTKEVCKKAAQDCSLRSEFAVRYKGEYFAALRNGWLDEICKHMQVIGNLYKRCIYAYEFPNIDGNNYIYIGLTDHIQKRDKTHGRKGSVFNFCKEHNIHRPTPIQLTEYVDKEQASELEGTYLLKYLNDGWLPINRVKTGGLGGHLTNDGYTYDQCYQIGHKYNNRSAWKKNDYPTYYKASQMGWIDTILAQRERFGNSQQTFWTKERILLEVAKFKYLKDFAKANPTAYHIVLKNGWFDELCGNLLKIRKDTGYTIEIVQKEIEKYETLTDFIHNCPRMYDWLCKRKIKLSSISNKQFKKPIGNPKRIDQYTIDGEYVRSFDSAREAVLYGFDYKKISAVCTGRRKTHNGFIFRFSQIKKETSTK